MRYLLCPSDTRITPLCLVVPSQFTLNLVDIPLFTLSSNDIDRLVQAAADDTCSGQTLMESKRLFAAEFPFPYICWLSPIVHEPARRCLVIFSVCDRVVFESTSMFSTLNSGVAPEWYSLGEPYGVKNFSSPSESESDMLCLKEFLLSRVSQLF